MIILKKFLVFVCALSMLFCCLTVAYAEGEGESSGETPVEDNSGDTPAPVVVVSGEGDTPAAVVIYDLDDADAPASGSLPATVLSVFGTYAPRTQSVTTYLPDGTTVQSTEIVRGIAGVDWYWISGVVVFLLILWSFFKLLGVVFIHG